ncbi:Putative nitric oxide synthase-binding protein, partial [Gryllus bimaculatus]
GCGGVGGGGETYASPLGEPLRATPGEALPSAGTPLGAHHELQLLREQLEQQAQQTQAAARTHQLLVHNKELLDHIAVLVAHLQEQERHLAAAQATNQHQHQQQQHQQQRLIQQSLTHQTPHVVTSVPQTTDKGTTTAATWALVAVTGLS